MEFLRTLGGVWTSITRVSLPLPSPSRGVRTAGRAQAAEQLAREIGVRGRVVMSDCSTAIVFTGLYMLRAAVVRVIRFAALMERSERDSIPQL
eukprot:6218315-Pyramimonas_sp.AAC.2